MQRAVANYNELLLNATSGCEDHSWQGILKVGKCIDIEAWEKEKHHWVSVYEGYLKNFTCEYLRQTL